MGKVEIDILLQHNNRYFDNVFTKLFLEWSYCSHMNFNQVTDFDIFSTESFNLLFIACEPESRMLPTPREFFKHVLSERTTQAASNKRRLHPENGGISL